MIRFTENGLFTVPLKLKPNTLKVYLKVKLYDPTEHSTTQLIYISVWNCYKFLWQ